MPHPPPPLYVEEKVESIGIPAVPPPPLITGHQSGEEISMEEEGEDWLRNGLGREEPPRNPSQSLWAQGEEEEESRSL